MNKKILLYIIFLLICSFSYALELNIYYYENKPHSFKENGQLKGIFIDLIKYIGNEEKWNINFIETDFNAGIENLKSSKISSLAVVAETAERQKYLTFNNETIFTNWGQVYSKNKNINSILDLKNKIVAVVPSDVYAYGETGLQYLNEKFELSIQFMEFKGYPEVIEAIRKGLVDAGVVSRSFTVKDSEINITPIVFMPVKLKIAFSKNFDQKIINKIDENLAKLKSEKSSVYYKILSSYFDIPGEGIPSWMKYLFIVSVAIIIILFINVYLLRKIVKRQTKKLSDSFEEITAQNEELEYSNKEIESLSHSLIKLIEIASKFGEKETTIEGFYEKLLQDAVEVIPEADYGSIAIFRNNKWNYVAAIGHSIEKLKMIPMEKDWFFTSNAVTIYEDILKDGQTLMPEPVSEKLKNATLKINASMVSTLNLDNDTMINIALDISRKEISFSEQSKKIFVAFGNIALAFLNLKLSNFQLRKTYLNFASKLAIIAEAHDDVTGSHIYRVSEISGFIAKKLGLSDELIEDIYNFSILHDIGKIFVSPEILNKPGKLSDDEWLEMKKHTIYAKRLLDDQYFKTALNIALYHHEKHDGSGYPFGIGGKDIPIEAQIVSVVDVYDALRSERSYKKAYNHEEAYNIIFNGDTRTKPFHFNPQILNIMKKYESEIIDIYGGLAD